MLMTNLRTDSALLMNNNYNEIINKINNNIKLIPINKTDLSGIKELAKIRVKQIYLNLTKNKNKSNKDNEKLLPIKHINFPEPDKLTRA
jgi:hypothetical protein